MVLVKLFTKYFKKTKDEAFLSKYLCLISFKMSAFAQFLLRYANNTYTDKSDIDIFIHNFKF